MTTAYASSAAADDDASLAVAAASGDRIAFAAIYDRYANRLHDYCVGMLRDREAAADCVQDVFVTAATRLGQLREPDRLRSWLYAIARNEALARIRERRREQPSDDLPEIASSEPDLATVAARTELADLIKDACGGLTDRDQVVLELSFRQGLSGPELAAALGVTPRNANTLVDRLRETIARSLGALLVCRQVRTDPARCPELAAIVENWDGQFTVLMRKRVARHIDSCAVCEERRASMVTPAALLGSTPLLIPAPAWLREATLSHAAGAVPSPGTDSWWPPNDFDVSDLPDKATPPDQRPGYLRRHMGAVIGVAVIIVGGGAALAGMPRFYSVDPAGVTGNPTPTTAPPSAHVVSGSNPTPEPAGTPLPRIEKTRPPESSPEPPAPSSPTGTPVQQVPPAVPVTPPDVGDGPALPPRGPGKTIPGPVGPVQPPRNPGPVPPPSQPGGPVTSGGQDGPVTPPKSGPIVDPGPAKPPANPPKSPEGPVINPGRVPPHRNGGSNSCTPPTCIQPSGPLQ